MCCLFGWEYECNVVIISVIVGFEKYVSLEFFSDYFCVVFDSYYGNCVVNVGCDVVFCFLEIYRNG